MRRVLQGRELLRRNKAEDGGERGTGKERRKGEKEEDGDGPIPSVTLILDSFVQTLTAS
jgi:hypothetical protein